MIAVLPTKKLENNITIQNLKWITTTSLENVSLYGDIDHDMKFYRETNFNY